MPVPRITSQDLKQRLGGPPDDRPFIVIDVRLNTSPKDGERAAAELLCLETPPGPLKG